MENQPNADNQNAQQVGQSMSNQSVQIPEKPKINYWMVSTLILAVLSFGILSLYLFSAYKANRSGLNITPAQPPLSNEFVCSQDNDCVIGIQATSCCSCPEAVNKKLIETNNWEQYEFGKSYSSQQTKSCGVTVACKPCEFPETPVCSSGECKFPNQINIQPSDTQKQNVSVSIQLKKTTYGLGEPIAFTITNNTQQSVYYFPGTCASSLVHVFMIPNANSLPVPGDPIVCMLAPSVETLLPNGNIASKITDEILSKMVPGRYKVKFRYSLEKRDRFVLGEKSTIESEILTVSE